MRVLVDDVKDCYAALGLVHHLWSPIPRSSTTTSRSPKANDYRSLHTAVIGPEGKALEVQIRTARDAPARPSSASPRTGATRRARAASASYDEKIAWLRQMLEWKDEIGDAGELAEQFRTGLFEDTIYVLTPQGRVIDLPQGSTPIDFAYHVHTELGHRCRGAKVDGAIVPLNTALANGQQVEITRREAGRPEPRLAQPGAGLRREPRRARQGAAVVQPPEPRDGGRAGPRGRREGAAAAGDDETGNDTESRKARRPARLRRGR